MKAVARWLRLDNPPSARKLVWGVLGVALAFLALYPYAFLVTHIFVLLYWGLPLALLAGVVGYLPRRRWSDALWLGLPMLAANAIEQHVGTPALVCLAMPWFALTKRPRFSILLGCSLLAALLIGIQLKARFAGNRLTWQDVQYFFAQFGDNVSVVASQPTVALWTIVALTVFAALVYGGWWWDRRDEPRAAPLGPSWAPALLSIALVFWCAGRLQQEVETARKVGIWKLSQTPGWSMLPISRFLATAALKPEWMPRKVDTSQFREDVNHRLGGAAKDRALPDVVLFLQESQMNPAAIGGCPPQLCRLPVFEGGPETRVMGPLRVHVFGAGTWLSEFAVVTGVPHTAFGDAGEFAPFSVTPGIRRSFVRSLRSAGYHTVAIYPTRGGYMNGRLAYAGYGFDRFYDATDLGLSGSFSTTDDEIHQAALRVLERERKLGKPVLLFVLTIFNHGEHGVKMDRVHAPLREQMRAQLPDAREADTLADYVWRTGEFQRVMAGTRRAVLQGARPAVLAWYGDHQPAFGSVIGIRDRIKPQAEGVPPQYLTWYEISSNVAGSAKPSPAPLDITFLPGLLAQVAGIPLDEWLAANVAAREGCGGLLDECRQPQVRDSYLSFLWRDVKAFNLP